MAILHVNFCWVKMFIYRNIPSQKCILDTMRLKLRKRISPVLLCLSLLCGRFCIQKYNITITLKSRVPFKNYKTSMYVYNLFVWELLQRHLMGMNSYCAITQVQRKEKVSHLKWPFITYIPRYKPLYWHDVVFLSSEFSYAECGQVNLVCFLFKVCCDLDSQ